MKYVVIQLFLVCSISLMICGVLEAKQTVIVGMDRSYAPYAFLDANGNPTGFEADLIAQVAKRSGWIVEYRVDKWSTITKDFDDGKIDLLTGYIQTEQRTEHHVFSNPHTYVHYSVFQRKGSAEIREWSDLNGKELLIETDDISQEIISTKQIMANKTFVDDYSQVLSMLSRGQGDVSIMPKILGTNYIKVKRLNNLISTSALDFAYPYCMSTNREKSYLIYTVNLALEQMEDDGTLGELRKKWFVSDYNLPNRRILSRTSLLLFLSVVIAFALIIGFFLIFYRKFLAKQTEYIQEQIREKEEVNRELGIVHSLYIDGPVIFMKWHDMDKEMFKFVSQNISTLGYLAEDFINGTIHYRDIIHPEDIIKILADRQVHINNKDLSYQQEYRILCPSELISSSDSPAYHMLKLQNPVLEKAQSITIRWVKDHTVIIPATDTEPCTFQGYIFDITDQHNHNTELQTNRLIAESADQSKDIFLASITDEVKKPIKLLNESIVKLSRTQPSDEQNDALIKIYSSSYRLDNIITQIHKYIRYSKNDYVPANVWINLQYAIESILTDMQIRSAAQNITFDCSYPRDSIKLFMNHQYFDDAINIIFDNALKFTSAGAIDLHILFEKVSAIDGILTINICDEGEGIPPDRLEYIFKPFTQVDASYTRVHGGLGLGLAILSRIMEHSDGKVTIKNRETGGTELTITWNVPYKS
ncbi:MAG: hypothetical protein CVU48_00770 [Candidatus Cloacimonetes bacterium HGW-Cloacimonetes-1]|jgi:signal transduction histidine kinase|nr:MAG: hypothetical protein CVU48_00770 [Candidatus Cloacimonetes bacterium HGW-Cloacimonetes-1]